MAHFKLLSFATADELVHVAANAWLDEVETAHRAKKSHCVALSGGRITRKFFTATAEQNQTRKVSFASVHFFWADERCVPPADHDSNYKLANELLFAPLQIPANQIHRIRGEDSPQAAVIIAEAELRRIAPADKNDQPVLDLIFLGLGEDGHVASLFPNAGAEITASTAPFLFVENSPKPPPRRISLSYAALQAAKAVWVLASGTGKERILQVSLAAGGQTPLARVIQSRPPLSPAKIFSDLAGF